MTERVEITLGYDNLTKQVYLETLFHGRQTGCPPDLKGLGDPKHGSDWSNMYIYGEHSPHFLLYSRFSEDTVQ